MLDANLEKIKGGSFMDPEMAIGLPVRTEASMRTIQAFRGAAVTFELLLE